MARNKDDEKPSVPRALPPKEKNTVPKYPTPKKGQRVDCLGCNGGLVYDKRTGSRSCEACGGKGYTTA